MTEQPGQPPQIPPAFNGHRPSERLAELVEQLPQMLVNAFASVLRQVPVRTQGSPWRCTQCVMGRLAWIRANEQEVTAAHSAYVTAMTGLAALPDGNPRKDLVPEFAMFLPPALRRGGDRAMPPIADGTVLVNGAAWCMDHVPGAPGSPGKTQLLVASAAFTPGMLAGLSA